MKFIIFSLISCLSSVTLAAGPIDLVGEYQFTDRLEQLTAFQQEWVSTLGSRGKERVRILRSEGYTCVVKPRSNYLCKKFISETMPEPFELQKIIQKHAGLQVVFEEARGPAELIIEGEVYREYKVPQMLIGNKTYPHYRYAVLGENAKLHKIIAGEKNELQHHLIVEDSNLLSQIVEFRSREGRRTRIHYLKLFLVR